MCKQTPYATSAYLKKGVRALIVLIFIASIPFIMFGGAFFWSYHIASALFNNNGRTELNELELSRIILQNTKRMVGDQEAWSKAVREEYDNIFAIKSSAPKQFQENLYPRTDYALNSRELESGYLYLQEY